MDSKVIIESLLQIEERGKAAKCQTCFDTGKESEWRRCPKCNYDDVMKYGFKFDGKVIGPKNQNQTMTEFFKKMPIGEGRCFVGPAGTGKSLFLKLIYNHYLHELRFLDDVVMVDEDAMVMAFREGVRGTGKIARAKVVIWDELGQEHNWREPMAGVQSIDLYGFLKYLVKIIHDGKKTLYAASNYDFRETIKQEGIVRRLCESMPGGVVSVK